MKLLYQTKQNWVRVYAQQYSDLLQEQEMKQVATSFPAQILGSARGPSTAYPAHPLAEIAPSGAAFPDLGAGAADTDCPVRAGVCGAFRVVLAAGVEEVQVVLHLNTALTPS